MRFPIKGWSKNLLVCFMLTCNLVLLNSCNKNVENKRAMLVQRFENYLKEQNVSNFGGIKSLDCVDSLTYSGIKDLEFQIDSIRHVRIQKMKDVAEYYGNLSNYRKQQLESKYLEICKELLDLDKDNKAGASDPMWELKKAWSDISPLNEPIYFHKVVADIDKRETTFYGVSCGDSTTFVVSDNVEDVMLKNNKLEKLVKSYALAHETKLIPNYKVIIMIDKMINGEM